MRPLHLIAGITGVAAAIAAVVLVLGEDSASSNGLSGETRDGHGLSALEAGETRGGGLEAGADVRRNHGELLGASELAGAQGAGRSSSGRVVRDRDGVAVPNLALRLSSQNPARAQMRGWNLRREMLDRFAPLLGAAFADDAPKTFGELARVQTDDAGRFAIPGENEGWFVSVDDPFYYLARSAEPIFGRREEVLEVALGARIAGKITLPEKPVQPALALLSSGGGGEFPFGGRGGRGGNPFRGGFDPSQALRGAELDGEGAFAFNGLPAGDGARYQVWIVAPGVATFAAPSIDVHPGLEQRLDLALDPGVEVRGLVRDRAGAPIRGALVRVAFEGPAQEATAANAERGNRGEERQARRRGEGQDGGNQRGGPGGAGGLTRFLAATEPFLEATTDASGAFVLKGFGDGAYRAEITASGFVPDKQLRFQVRFGGHDELVIELEPARLIEGTVRLSDGRPVPGAAIEASEIREENELASLGMGDLGSFGGFGGDFGGRGGMREMFRGAFARNVTAVSDGRGRFSMPDVPASWKLILLSASTETGLRGAKELGEAKAGVVDAPEIVVAPTSSVVADLVYPEGSTPAEQLTLSLLAGEMPIPQRTESFTWPPQSVALVDVAPGDYTLMVQAKGFASTSLPVKVENPIAPTEVLVELRPGAEIRGLALESTSGRPIGGAEISLEIDFGALRDREGGAALVEQMRNVRVSARTDEQGRFVLADLSAGKLALRGDHPDFPSGKGPSIELKEGQLVEDYRVSFVPGGRITGTVVDAQGAPRANATVMASSTTGGGEGRGGRGGGGQGNRPARTDDSGLYSIDRLQPGEYRVALSNGGGGGRGEGEIVGSMKTVEVLPGQTAIVDFDATDEPLASLLGTLKKGDDVVRGGTARLSVSGGGRVLNARIGEDGTFRFDELPIGTHRVSFQPQAAPAEEGERGRRPRGPSAGGAGIEVVIEQPGETQREFTLPGGSIAGVVSSPSGNLRNVRVRLLVVESSGVGREVSSSQADRESGSFTFDNLEAGLYRLVAEPPGGEGGRGGRGGRGAEGGETPAPAEELAAVSMDVELAADTVRNGVVLRFTSGGTLRFKVVDDAGEVVPNARVTLQGIEGVTRSIEESGGSDREGAGSIDGLAPGAYDARITARGFATTSGGEVLIAAGGEIERTFRVARGVSFSLEIVDHEGKPVPDARIEVRGEGDELLGTFPSQGGGRFGGGGRQLDGIYTLGSYPEGRYRLVVARGASMRQQSFSVRHADGARPRVSLAKEE